MKYFVLFLMLVIVACSTRNTNNQDTSVVVRSDESLDIEAKVIAVEPLNEKFKIIAILHNETGVKDFNKGDTVSLHPNFIRREGQPMLMDDPLNKKMSLLKESKRNSIIKATVKIRGTGKKPHGLIMKIN